MLATLLFSSSSYDSNKKLKSNNPPFGKEKKNPAPLVRVCGAMRSRTKLGRTIVVQAERGHCLPELEALCRPAARGGLMVLFVPQLAGRSFLSQGLAGAPAEHHPAVGCTESVVTLRSLAIRGHKAARSPTQAFLAPALIPSSCNPTHC